MEEGSLINNNSLKEEEINNPMDNEEVIPRDIMGMVGVNFNPPARYAQRLDTQLIYAIIDSTRSSFLTLVLIVGIIQITLETITGKH